MINLSLISIVLDHETQENRKENAGEITVNQPSWTSGVDLALHDPPQYADLAIGPVILSISVITVNGITLFGQAIGNKSSCLIMFRSKI